MKRLRGGFTYANVVSTLCLVLLVGGGTAIAAGGLAKDSVGTRQLKNGAVTKSKLASAARAALRGVPGSGGEAGAKGEAGQRGLTGEPGAEGPPGHEGASAMAGAVEKERFVGGQTVAADGYASATVECPSGDRAVGGGGEASVTVDIFGSRPNPSGEGTVAKGWEIGIHNPSANPIGWDATVWAICVAG